MRFNCTLQYANEIESDPMKVKVLTNLVLLVQKWPWFRFSQNINQWMQNSVGRIFLIKCIKQSNVFCIGKQVIGKLQVKRKISYTFRNPWNHLHIADIVFSWSKSSATFHIWIFFIISSVLTLDDVLFPSIFLFHVLFW